MHLLKILASYCHGNLLGPAATRFPGMAVMQPVRQYSSDQGLGYFASKREADTVERPSSPPPAPRWQFPIWLRWAFGSVLTLVLPFWSRQWRALPRIEGEVEVAAELVEEAAEVVEKVAIMTEKASSKLAEELPENGKLKDAVLLVERVSKEAEAEAHLAQDIIHKVDELKEEVENRLQGHG